MIMEGHIVLFPFPHANQTDGALRPALVLRRCPGPYKDWLVCMISLQVRHAISEIDEIVHSSEPEFFQTGQKQTSLIRATRLAIVAESMLQGIIGNIDEQRLARIQTRIASWISQPMRAVG